MILFILLIVIAMLLLITYSYIRSWKKYIIKSWKKGIKKALNMNKEDIQKEIIKNNKKTVAVIIHLSKLKFDYWKYISLLNIESSALYFLLNNEEYDINNLINLKENEIMSIGDNFYDVNKTNVTILKDKNTEREDPEIKKYIIALKKGEKICSMY